MKYAMDETERRRNIQIAYNTAHHITPKTIIKKIQDITDQMRSEHDKAVGELVKIDRQMLAKDPAKLKKLIAQKEKQMDGAVKILDFETAALLRDEIVELTKLST
jgi:excinuclease ABC subunit B